MGETFRGEGGSGSLGMRSGNFGGNFSSERKLSRWQDQSKLSLSLN